jgi:hypothetical protein
LFAALFGGEANEFATGRINATIRSTRSIEDEDDDEDDYDSPLEPFISATIVPPSQ